MPRLRSSGRLSDLRNPICTHMARTARTPAKRKEHEFHLVAERCPTQYKLAKLRAVLDLMARGWKTEFPPKDGHRRLLPKANHIGSMPNMDDEDLRPNPNTGLACTAARASIGMFWARRPKIVIAYRYANLAVLDTLASCQAAQAAAVTTSTACEWNQARGSTGMMRRTAMRTIVIASAPAV